jgi:t-SNARE complex subunit (syntaxin)
MRLPWSTTACTSMARRGKRARAKKSRLGNAWCVVVVVIIVVVGGVGVGVVDDRESDRVTMSQSSSSQ